VIVGIIFNDSTVSKLRSLTDSSSEAPMFFYFSKLMYWAIQPLTWLAIALGAGAWLLHRNRYKAASWVLNSTFAVTAAVLFLPVAPVLMRSLEQQFSPLDALPATVHGVIVLGGAAYPTLTADHGKPQLGEEAERVTEMVALAKAYPDAKFVYSGNSSRIGGEPIPETEVLRRFLEGQGVVIRNLLLEDKSRNTRENAVYSRELAQPQPGETWLLVTSAYHMPRAYRVFAKAGWNVVPYPVSYSVRRTFSWDERAVSLLATGIREWIGLAAYKLSGWI
jgi:uncharacterized SAM-binding protein YcdF (DUF218 family)